MMKRVVILMSIMMCFLAGCSAPREQEVLYQEKSVPVEPSGAIPDTDSNDEGMLDMEKEPVVINL